MSKRPSGELHITERWYGNGREVAVGDVFLMTLAGHKPHAYQPENHYIDPAYYCAYEGAVNWEQIVALSEKVGGPLWINGPSSYSGLNDRLPEAAAPALQNSLKLVLVSDLNIIVALETSPYGSKRAVRGRFSLAGCFYILKITDPLVEAAYIGREPGTYSIGAAALCISLGEAFKDYAYKLIASVIVKG